MEAGEKENERPPRAFYFSIIAIFMGIPSGSLCGGERFRRTTAFLNLFISLRKIILLKQRGLCEPSEITEILSIVNVEVFTGCLLQGRNMVYPGPIDPYFSLFSKPGGVDHPPCFF